MDYRQIQMQGTSTVISEKNYIVLKYNDIILCPCAVYWLSGRCAPRPLLRYEKTDHCRRHRGGYKTVRRGF